MQLVWRQVAENRYPVSEFDALAGPAEIGAESLTADLLREIASLWRHTVWAWRRSRIAQTIVPAPQRPQ